MADVFEWMDEWGPEKIIVVHDTKTGMMGMLVIDNTARGVGKGGCRMDPNMTLHDCFRLARTMTAQMHIRSRRRPHISCETTATMSPRNRARRGKAALAPARRRPRRPP